MTRRRLPRLVFIGALSLAVMATSSAAHPLPRSSGWGPVISPPSLGTSAAAPSAEGPRPWGRPIRR